MPGARAVGLYKAKSCIGDEHNFYHIFVLLFIYHLFINNATRVFLVCFADKFIRRRLDHKDTLSRP